MARQFSASRKNTKSMVALLLTFSAGIVDIVAYITVYHMFVAHMTGTTVHLGNTLAVADWADCAKSASVLLGFVTGSLLGRGIIELGSRAQTRTVASITLLAEGALILSFIWVRPWILPSMPARSVPLRAICFLLAMLAAAMGLQTATLTRIGPLTIHTTFVTGMLNKLAQSISQWIFWVHDNWRKHQNARLALRGSGQHPAFRNAQLVLAIWFSYMMGSIAGTWMNSKWSTSALYVPVFILIVSIALDQVQPLSIEEEQDQA